MITLVTVYHNNLEQKNITLVGHYSMLLKLNNTLSAVIYGKSMNYSTYLSRTSMCNNLITFTTGGHNQDTV